MEVNAKVLKKSLKNKVIQKEVDVTESQHYEL